MEIAARLYTTSAGMRPVIMELELRERFGRWRCNHWDLATDLMRDPREGKVVGMALRYLA